MKPKIKIFFLTLAYPTDSSDRNLYSDLIDEIASRGNEVIVFKPDESRTFGRPSEVTRIRSKIISIPTGKITKVGQLIKAINTLMLEGRFKKVVSQYIDVKPDVVIYSTPPITFVKVIEFLKRKTGCSTYLLLKDIFPQNAVDLGMIKKDSIIYEYFRRKEKRLYKISDQIGCMSPANVEYVLKHNPEIDSSKLHVNPNSMRPTPIEEIPSLDISILEQYGIPKDKFRLVYGGNLGKPQGIDFLLESITALSALPDVHLTIIGDGTEYRRIEKYIMNKQLTNVTLLKTLPKSEYKALLACMDVGLIFLDSKFTIPNFPSRVLDYMDVGLPIITATDKATDLGRIIMENNAGLACESNDLENLLRCIKSLKNDIILRRNMAINSKSLLKNNYSINLSANLVLDFDRKEGR